MTIKELEIASLDRDLNFNAMLGSLQRSGLNVDRFNSINDTVMLRSSRMKLSFANYQYVKAKQSLREVKL